MAAELRAGSEIVVRLPRTGQPPTLTFNLNWRASTAAAEPTDLDVGCLYRSGGQVGAVQAVAPLDGAAGPGADATGRSAAAIGIDRDDRDGSAVHGETLRFHDPRAIEFAIVFASIYRGVSDFRLVQARLTIAFSGGQAAQMSLANPDPGLRWCAILACGMQDDHFVVVPQERYFLSAQHADRHYRFGLDWAVGFKQPDRVASEAPAVSASR